MPLIIEGKPMQELESVSDFLLKYPHFQIGSRQLKSSQPLHVGTEMPYLFLHQMEVACVSVDDPNIDMLGLDEMTTCCGVVIRHTGSFSMGAGHFDGQDTEGGIQRIIDGVVSLTKEWMKRNRINEQNDISGQYHYEVHIVGGFDDSELTSDRVVMQVLTALHKSALDIHIKTACICSNNTYYRPDDLEPQPQVTGLLCNIKTGQILPASFSFRGPLQEVRNLRFSMQSPVIMHSVYNPLTRILEIKSFKCTLSDHHIDRLLVLDSKTFLNYMSTSPNAESPNYVSNLKLTLKFLKNNRDTLFQPGKLYRFTKSGSKWEPIEY